MAKLLIWTIGNKVNEDLTPSERYKVKLDKVIELYKANKDKFDEVVILISGRWANPIDNTPKTESRVGKEYIQNEIPNVIIFEENISVELIGNFAFSKRIMMQIGADHVIGVIQEIVMDRAEYLVEKIFSDAFKSLEIIYTKDNLLLDKDIIQKNKKAFNLCQKLLLNVKAGDDSLVRDILLYKTPYYFYQTESSFNQSYFDEYWEGGFEDYIKGRNAQLLKK